MPPSSEAHLRPVPKHSVAKRWRRRLRYFYLRFVRLRGTSKELARGLAAGVFAGLFPLFGLQTIIGVVIASLLRGNKLMAAAGTWISNPLTYVPIYAFNYQVGRWLLGRTDSQPFDNQESLQNWLEMGVDVTAVMFLGCLVMGLLCSVLSYLVGLPLIKRGRQRYRQMRSGPAS